MRHQVSRFVPFGPTIRPTFWLLAIALLALVPPLRAQSSGTIQGSVSAEAGGSPLAGVTVTIPVLRVGTLTDARGRFQLVGVPAGTHEVVAERLGLEAYRETVEIGSGGAVTLNIRLTEAALLIPTVVVSATRETQRLSETTSSVGVISSRDLQDVKPTHPSEIMSQVPGVWINVTGGEGHQTAIRQPKSTNPVYLFLEDGVPTRSTGFFNHNALYEVNLPQADRVEVLKGPASALYGSDAIGGVINVETRSPSSAPAFEAYVEGGGFGYARMLASASDTWGKTGLRADVNLTRTDGWRASTGYDRQSATLRWDSYFDSGLVLRSVVTGSRISQQTAGSSALPRDLYKNDPKLNLTPISMRNVEAFRASTAIEYTGEQALVSITPFVRWNTMEIMPNWALTYDPTIYDTGHSSVGLLARVRRDLPTLRTRVIAGVDIDHSPGGRTEHRLAVTRGSDLVFNSYELGELIYDYDVTFQGISPYVQTEVSPTDALHLTAGLRYDHMGYSYRSHLEPLQEGRWRRPEDADRSYDRLSPKLGVSYEFAPEFNLFANYTQGFRAPSEGQLFRQGTAANTLDLSPVNAISYETGVRGQILGRIGYSLALYRMGVENDILSYTPPEGTPETQNAGETLHRGVEAGLTLAFSPSLRGDISYSYAKHTYEKWSPRQEISFAGNEMESAPNTILNARLAYTPSFLPEGRFALEWNRIGSYWMDPENTHKYAGHNLFNVQAAVPLPHDLEVIGRIVNLADTSFAESASYTLSRGEELAPGMPRTVYLGLQYRWQR